MPRPAAARRGAGRAAPAERRWARDFGAAAPGGAEDMNLELTAEESEVLRDVLQSYLSDLGTEIAHTDSTQFREGLKHKKAILLRIVAALGDGAG